MADILYVKKFKTLWTLFMDGVQLTQGYKATTRRPFIFTTTFPKIPDTHLTDLEMMNGCVDLEATNWF